MFKTDLISVCKDINIWKERTVGIINWRLIDSNVKNARKCLGVKQNESLYEEGTWNICGDIQEWIVIWNVIYPGATPMGPGILEDMSN